MNLAVVMPLSALPGSFLCMCGFLAVLFKLLYLAVLIFFLLDFRETNTDKVM